jgi:hypothetical protein
MPSAIKLESQEAPCRKCSWCGKLHVQASNERAKQNSTNDHVIGAPAVEQYPNTGTKTLNALTIPSINFPIRRRSFQQLDPSAPVTCQWLSILVRRYGSQANVSPNVAPVS